LKQYRRGDGVGPMSRRTRTTDRKETGSSGQNPEFRAARDVRRLRLSFKGFFT
jgi:hypothetical protein